MDRFPLVTIPSPPSSRCIK